MTQLLSAGTVTYVAVNSAAMYALKASGILEKLPMYENLLDSGRDLQIAGALGGAITISQELLKLVMPETYGPSLLAAGHLLAFADHAAYNSLIALGATKSGLHEGVGRALEEWVSPDISEAVVNGMMIGVAEWGRTMLIQRANADGAPWIRWVLQPLTTISQTTGLGMQ